MPEHRNESSAAYTELVEAIEGVTNRYGCFGVCDTGKVSGSHLANHRPECIRLQLALGWATVPEDYRWDGERLICIPLERTTP